MGVKQKNAILSATVMYGFSRVNPPGFGASPIDGMAQPYRIAQGIRGRGPSTRTTPSSWGMSGAPGRRSSPRQAPPGLRVHRGLLQQ
ncbi:protein of unknown function [Methylacidimicrobium sp. AP8]|nr:protein of unknown function [Methylacidimicrobium sp. AP8]